MNLWLLGCPRGYHGCAQNRRTVVEGPVVRSYSRTSHCRKISGTKATEIPTRTAADSGGACPVWPRCRKGSSQCTSGRRCADSWSRRAICRFRRSGGWWTKSEKNSGTNMKAGSRFRATSGNLNGFWSGVRKKIKYARNGGAIIKGTGLIAFELPKILAVF